MKTVLAEVKLVDDETVGIIMGGSGTPIPSQDLIDGVVERYDPTTPIFPGQPLFPVDKVEGLFTPEALYPTTGVKSLEFDPSVAEGVSILNTAIMKQIAEGNNVVVGGGSQSATIESLEMRDLLALPAAERPTADQLSFVALVDVSAPNGGILERFDDPNLPTITVPSFGLTFSGATPADTPWDTVIYDQEYDGFSDFPRYPIDLLSDINAALGVYYVHGTLTDFTDAQIATAVKLPVSADYTGHTTYFMLPTQDLPLLDPLRAVPIVGNPLADLLQPDLKVLVNLGYGQIDVGWDTGPANVPTPISLSLFPTDINGADVLAALASGAQQGVADFIGDLGSLSMPSLPDAITSGFGAVDSLPSFTDIVNNFSTAIADIYTPLLALADSANALFTTLPVYDVDLFVQELTSGHPLDAIGQPIAADFGLVPLLVLFGIAGIS
ncbi:PE-PPE domain-containing protein [Mycobacterium sp.]|uniref:PE-PPE domain-containing protein n=1 Tax=Mycobacterium sp. TaxID=1785 RepID=UPI0031E040CC